MTKPPKEGKGLEINWFCLAAGGFLLLYAIRFYENTPITTLWGNYQYKLGESRFLLMFVLIAIGLYAISLAFKGSPTKKEDSNEILMCSTCDKDFLRKNTKDNKCPVCSTELEPLEGFYRRHPELKDRAEPCAQEKGVLCTACDTIFTPEEAPDDRCPVCGSETEPLRDIHERYS